MQHDIAINALNLPAGWIDNALKRQEFEIDGALKRQATLEHNTKKFEKMYIIDAVMGSDEQAYLFVTAGIGKHTCVIYRKMETSPASQPI